MSRRFLFVVAVLLCAGSIRTVAQESHPPQATEAARPTHGIIRKPQPKPSAEAAKPATTTEPAKTEPGKAEPAKTEAGKAPAHAKPAPAAASTEAVAAAIANAVRSLEEKEKKTPEAAHAQPARTRVAAPRAAAQRRYSVKWPSQRFEVQWAAPVDRVLLSWETGD